MSKKLNRSTRRNVIKSGIVALATALTPLSVAATAKDERQLKFYHTHTRQHLDVTYKRDGQFVPEALDEVNAFLGDFRRGDVEAMDPALLDILYELRQTLGSSGTYEIISAYRSPRTNEMLRSNSSGVARKSQHLLGKAIDVRLTDMPIERLRDEAIRMQRGGVGFYKKSNFVHIDTGRVRRW